MILARFKDAADYCGINPRLDRVIEYLNDDFLSQLGTEKVKIDGDKIYVTRFDYKTLPIEKCFFESHKKYLDVHLLLKGEERIDIAHPDNLEQFEQGDDYFGYHGQAEQTVILRPGSFLVVFPGDAHRVKVQVNGAEKVSKVVFKLLVNE